jgi:hypothetical protein
MSVAPSSCLACQRKDLKPESVDFENLIMGFLVHEDFRRRVQQQSIDA